MNNNPFLSTTFKKIWLKHYNNGKIPFDFKFIKDITFIKQNVLPLYINTGKNHTNGISYKLNQPNLNSDFKKKVFLIYDVPTYFKTDINTHNSKLKLNCVEQYNGVLTDVNEYTSYDDFYMTKFKSKTRYNLNKKKKQLETNFNISYSVYNENITEEEYGFLSLHLKKLITKRFNSRKENNQVVSEWNYYQELMFPLLKEKRAVIITVNHDNVPIGMTFNFLSDNVLFYAITTFDTDFIDFNIGHTTIMEVFKWSFDNKINIIDFSKGQTEYKSRWENLEYQFENHILYDSSSITATLLGKTITNYFKFKQFLRDKNFNLLFSKIKFALKRS